MAKHSLKSTETRDELSLPPEPWLIFYYLKLKSGIDTKRPVASLGKQDLIGTICHLLTIQQV